ncbi:RNA polymerase sigma-70 factor, ECF subfamily [Frankia sp. Hr75.2]|nr:RNA polymerase sigma-70 factor, ECF subfamily [Frankia sp. Hr75.2]
MTVDGETRAIMTGQDWLAARFDEHRAHLRSVAYRMLGSLHEADDAVQESWLRFSSADTSDVANLRGWLTTVTGRLCLDMLRSRGTRREQSLDVHVPDPIVSPADGVDPERRRCSRSRWGSRCTWSWGLSPLLSGWPSCCMTCSRCRSTTSRRCSAGRRRRPSSWRAGPGGGSGPAGRCRRRTWPSSTKRSARSSKRPVEVTSTRSSRSSRRMSRCVRTAAPRVRGPLRCSGERRRSPAGR